MYTIGEFSRLTELSIHTLRFYEKEELLEPRRDRINRRSYSEQDLAWVAFIKRLKNTGMSLKNIKIYSDLRKKGETTYRERLELLEEHTKNLDNKIASLLKNKENLAQKIAFYQEQIVKQR
ncbi:MerR family transcriptional regulator [Streptococcus dentapri]|uniref:MerR family transcriptional regulator n=1 Tax=Streptococcus dentapri TaxID=573564 RepID=A0ABV8CZS1_9STRE